MWTAPDHTRSDFTQWPSGPVSRRKRPRLFTLTLSNSSYRTWFALNCSPQSRRNASQPRVGKTAQTAKGTKRTVLEPSHPSGAGFYDKLEYTQKTEPRSSPKNVPTVLAYTSTAVLTPASSVRSQFSLSLFPTLDPLVRCETRTRWHFEPH